MKASAQLAVLFTATLIAVCHATEYQQLQWSFAPPSSTGLYETRSDILEISDNETVTFFQSFGTSASMSFMGVCYTAGSLTNEFTMPMNEVVEGPIKFYIKCKTTNPSGSSTLTAFFKIKRTDNLLTPTGTIVIPVDNGGAVAIILESSVDLVHWTAAMPGTYGTSEQSRFFRLRASRVSP
jgi:hypothetical protein